MSLSLTNSEDIIANSVSIINSKGQLVDLIQLLGETFIGLPPDTLDTLEKIATAIDNDPAFLTTVRALLDTKAEKINTYTKTEVNREINNVINAAPEALNTLKEIATALNDDANFAGTITNLISQKQQTLIVSVPSGGQAMLSGTRVLKGLTADSPLTLTNSDTNLTLGFNYDKITVAGPLAKTVLNGDVLKILCEAYTKDDVDYYLNQKQQKLLASVPSGGQALLSGTRDLKGLTASSPLTLSSTDSNLTLGFNYDKITVAGPLVKTVLNGEVLKI